MRNLSALRHLVSGASAHLGCHRGVALHAHEIDAERFWGRVDYSAGPDACWLWTGMLLTANGYGGFLVNGKARGAHRCAAALTHGEVPHGMIVMHTCDNPPCVNPAHLRIATQSDNMLDRAQKGRANLVARLSAGACWQHGTADKSDCDVCKLETQKAALQRDIDRRMETRGAFVAQARRRLRDVPLPTTSDELAEIVGRQRSIIFAARYGLFGLAPMRMSELAKVVGCSRQRIDQIVDAVTDKLREHAAANPTPEVAA